MVWVYINASVTSFLGIIETLFLTAFSIARKIMNKFNLFFDKGCGKDL